MFAFLLQIWSSVCLTFAFSHTVCNALIWFHPSDIQLELPQTELLLTSFLCFYFWVCVFNCCHQQTLIPLSLPCAYVCVSPFCFPPVRKKPDCMFMCVCMCMRDVQRNGLWYRESFRNAISSLSVYGCIHVEFIRIWKCCAAVPGLASPSVRSRSLALPFAHSLASAASLAGSCIRDEGLERKGRPSSGETNTYTWKLTTINRINMPRVSYTVCLLVSGWVGGDVVIRNRWVWVFKFSVLMCAFF